MKMSNNFIVLDFIFSSWVGAWTKAIGDVRKSIWS